MIATTAVLGLVAGTCAGFLIQADREPTELPSLSQPVLAQAEGEGPEPLSAAQDRQVKTDGDLRKLLLKKPRGAQDAESGVEAWLSLGDYAEWLVESEDMFSDSAAAGFRRAATTGWDVGDTYSVEIRLVQYHQEEGLSAAEQAGDWNVDGTTGWPIPGTGHGMAYVTNKPEIEPGYLPSYSAEAHASRGDIALEIFIYGTKPIPKKTIMDLAERQMERL